MCTHNENTNEIKERMNFIEQIVDNDLKEGKNDGRLQTRFPPEPNGYLHIGHAKAICMDFGIAERFGGKCNLRFDDTNPQKEDTEYVEAILEDIKWLGFQWNDIYYASDYFQQLWDFAVRLIKEDKAYIDEQSSEEIAAQKGITLGTAMDNLSTLIGSDYETGFVRFGKPYKVIVQADPKYRAFPQDLMQLNVKNNQGEMVPYADFLHMEKVYGMSEMTRHNLYNSAEVTGSAAARYSSGQAIKAIEEVATSTLPHGYDYDFAGITKDEVDQGNQALIIFIVCLTFVYLILSAQYENFLLPLPIITCLPAGICGTFIFLKLTGLENNIYAQVAMVMLIGLLGKNAVLMVEYAVQRHNLGKSIRAAAIEGAAARFRPILMTSFAFIAGLLPLVFAHGAGAIGNRTIGTAAAGGMLFGTCFGLILVPGLYYIFGRMADHVKMVRYQRNKPLTEEKDKRYKLENDEKK